MTTTRSMAIAAMFSVGLVAPALAAEDVTEHETYEKRSMKIETVPMAPPATVPAPTRVYEHHDESESSTVERHTTTPPPAIVKERTTNSVETQEKN
jgi:hypothetical protein